MLYRLKRHPFAIRAFFEHVLVLAYAFPRETLQPLLAPGLVLDTFKDKAFLAIALVWTRKLRPAFAPPWLGLSFFLSGYRVFARYATVEGRTLRGLRILRSDTDRRSMALLGNLFTHYRYGLARVAVTETDGALEIDIRTPNAQTDLHVIADLAGRPGPLPEGSPFADVADARRFAGPLPFTFAWEPQTRSIIRIQGHREAWDPQPVRVDVKRATYLESPALRDAQPVLANAFYLQDVPYRWTRGVRERVAK